MATDLGQIRATHNFFFNETETGGLPVPTIWIRQQQVGRDREGGDREGAQVAQGVLPGPGLAKISRNTYALYERP